ncbi:PAS domain-containing protein [Pollutibacter soli]|uniref:PAS domain-containing protein n=1 Tax=Pollutibacter soli TaxID=3034157 RepID=UPI003013C70A
MMHPGKDDHSNHFKLLLEEGLDGNLFERITDFFPAIIYVYDAERKQLGYVNKQLKEVLGYSIEDVKGWDGDMLKMVFKDDVDAVKQELSHYEELTDDASYSFGCRFNRKEGDFFHFRVKGTVLRRSPDGKPGSILFVAQDITREVNSEAEVKASLQLIDDSEDLLKYGTWKLDIGTGKMKMSRGMYKLLGYPDEKEVPEPDLALFLNHVDKEALPDLQGMFDDSIIRGKEFEHSYEITGEDGITKSVSSKTRVVVNEDGTVKSVLGITWDVTRYYSLYRDLLHYKNMVLEKELFLNNGSWEYDVATGTMEWSEGMFHLFGYENTTEYSGRKVDRAFMNSHQSVEEAIKSNESWEHALATDDYFIREERIATRSGESKLIETYGKIIRDKKGVVEKVLGTTRDITKLREYELKLEHKIEELARSNRDLEEFAYVASHDLQEPLRKIATFSERLSSRFSELLGTDGGVYLERMKGASENMRILIDNLLEFSRTTRNEPYFEKIDLNQPLNNALKELELKMEETKAIVISDNLPQIQAVKSQMQQLFNNLISNAVKFSKPGLPPEIQIRYRILPAEEKKRFNLNGVMNYIELRVQDNGIGFEKEYEERIFKIFQRLHGKSEYPGSGIGLAICKKIVDHHKGIIYAESERGKGSSFIFILPEKQYS